MAFNIFRKNLSLKRNRPFRPVLEALEDRCVPSVLPVMNTTDSGMSGDGSLRGEILAAKNGDTIVFSPQMGKDIFLVHGELPVAKSITIQGPGAGAMSVHGSSSRVFEIAAGSTVTIQGLTIADGDQLGDGTPFSSQGGGILNHGDLTLNDDILQNNRAFAWKNYDGQGGGLYNDGLTTLHDVQFLGNTAVGGDKSGIAGNGEGGGLFNAGQVFIYHGAFTGNQAQGGNAFADAGGLAGAGNGEGGGLFNYTSGGVSISDQSLFDDNVASGGGTDAPGGFNGGGEGGGLDNFAGSIASFGTTFQNNFAIAGMSNVPTDQFAGSSSGGGLANDDGSLSLYGDVITNNLAEAGGASAKGISGGNAYGGGLYTAGGQVYLSALVFQNTATAGEGGANALGQGGVGGAGRGGGVYSYKTDLQVAGSQFTTNSARGGDGGVEGEFGGGQGGLAQGGALYLYAPNNAGDGYQQLDAKFDQNRAIGGDSGRGGFAGDAQGGAIFLAKGNLAFTPATTFTGNLAQGGTGRDGDENNNPDLGDPNNPFTSAGGAGGNGQGGALYIAVGSVKVNQNKFQQNQAIGGKGGLGGWTAFGDHFQVLTGSTGGIGGYTDGGAVYQAAGAGQLDIRGALFESNSATGGDGGYGGLGQGANGGSGGMGGGAEGGALFAADGLSISGSSIFDKNAALAGAGGFGGNSQVLATIEGLQGGAGGTGGAGVEADGGAISLRSANATMKNVVLTDNQAIGGSGRDGGSGSEGNPGGAGSNGAAGAGGGLFISGGSATIQSTTVLECTAEGADGGSGAGLYTALVGKPAMGADGGDGGDGLGGGLAAFNASVNLSLVTISKSSGEAGNGGDGGLGVLEGGTGGKGGAAFGGGILNVGSNLTLVNDTVSLNSLNPVLDGLGGRGGLNLVQQRGGSGIGGRAQGGGLYQLSGQSSISNSTFDHNEVSGGVTFPSPNMPKVPVQVPDASGGGLFFDSGTANITNSTIFRNGTYEDTVIVGGIVHQQGGEGGGLRNLHAAVQLTNDTIAGNFSGVGGGVSAHDLTIVNTLIGGSVLANSDSRNSDLLGDPDFHAESPGKITDLGHNLIGNGGLSIGVFKGPGDLLGTAAKPIDPMLGPLAYNGGPTQTLALLAGSLAIDHGQTSAIDPISGKTLSTDQRGFHRPSGLASDIGAFELQGGKMKRTGDRESVPPSDLQPFQAMIDSILAVEAAPPMDRQLQRTLEWGDIIAWIFRDQETKKGS
jgi:hypothetical protein